MSDHSPTPGPGRPEESVGRAPAGEETVGSAPGEGALVDEAPYPRVDGDLDRDGEIDAEETVGPATPMPQPPFSRPDRSGLWIRIAAGVAAVLLVGGLGWYFGRDNVAGDSTVGDCLTEAVVEAPPADPSQINTVACDSPDAAYKIVGVVEDRTREESTQEGVCAGYPMTTGLWVGRDTGSVYCLEAAAR